MAIKAVKIGFSNVLLFMTSYYPAAAHIAIDSRESDRKKHTNTHTHTLK